MIEISDTAYIWIKAGHIISVIAWMAGLFYLPRLYVYHSNALRGSELSETLKIMERRLYRVIMVPAMLLSIIFGGLLTYYLWPEIMQEGWAHVKTVCIFLMIIFNFSLGGWRRKFERDANEKSESFYRKINEIPTVLMIIIVIAVIVRPF